jgi:hypothetical protein
VAIAVASLALAIVVIALLSGYFSGNDQASVSGGRQLGQQFADQGNALLIPGTRHPAYDSNPPTSGPHWPVPVVADGVALTDDQLLEALATGDVVFVYGSARPPAGLRAIASRLAGPFTPVLAQSGNAVILTRRPRTIGIIALAWTRMLRLSHVEPTLLSEFAQEWLGRGAH